MPQNNNLTPDGSKNTNSNAPGNVPLIGGGAPTSTPNYALQGNGDLSKDAIDAIFPSLLNLIKQNSPNSCTNIATVRYYVDPLGKIIAFMLACPESSGNSAHEIVTVTASN